MITDEQIWNYLDGTLDEASRKEVALSIANDKGTADLFQEISALHKSLMADTLLKPSASFTNTVMASIAPTPVKSSIVPLVLFITPVVLALIACVAYLVYNNISVTYTLPSFSLPAPGRYTMYFILTDIVILVFFLEALSEYRFNRKTFFSE